MSVNHCELPLQCTLTYIIEWKANIHCQGCVNYSLGIDPEDVIISVSKMATTTAVLGFFLTAVVVGEYSNVKCR